MKVIFLDIDGVLITHRSMRMFRHIDGALARTPDPECVANLQRIVDTAGAKIVVSSTWRLGRGVDGMRAVLTGMGLRAEVVGVTPELVGAAQGGGWFTAKPRRDEIAAWLAEQPDVTAWCAIDDDADAGPERIVLTDFSVGLTTEKADESIALLSAEGAKR